MSIGQWLYDFFTCAMIVYSLLLLFFYLFIAIFSVGETRRYMRKSSFTDYAVLASSEQSPSISILAPAYNEGANIIENVRSLLNIHYNNVELIVINDGSQDDSLQKLIEAYEMEILHFIWLKQY